MHLEASCHCRSVRFSVESHEPMPFMRCYCSICRKTAGTGGFAINLGADHATLKVDGMEHVSVYRASRVAVIATSASAAARRCGSGIPAGPSSCIRMPARSTPRCRRRHR